MSNHRVTIESPGVAVLTKVSIDGVLQRDVRRASFDLNAHDNGLPSIVLEHEAVDVIATFAAAETVDRWTIVLHRWDGVQRRYEAWSDTLPAALRIMADEIEGDLDSSLLSA